MYLASRTYAAIAQNEIGPFECRPGNRLGLPRHGTVDSQQGAAAGPVTLEPRQTRLVRLRANLDAVSNEGSSPVAPVNPRDLRSGADGNALPIASSIRPAMSGCACCSRRNSVPNMTRSCEGDVVVTVAVRRPSPRIAISPK